MLLSMFPLKWRKQISGLFSTINPKIMTYSSIVYGLQIRIRQQKKLWILNCVGSIDAKTILSFSNYITKKLPVVCLYRTTFQNFRTFQHPSLNSRRINVWGRLRVQGTTTYHFKATETLQKFAIPIFQSMCLINDCNSPVNGTQFLQVRDDHFICCYQSMKFVHIRYSITLKHIFQYKYCYIHVCYQLTGRTTELQTKDHN